jgi:hypothetical protein
VECVREQEEAEQRERDASEAEAALPEPEPLRQRTAGQDDRAGEGDERVQELPRDVAPQRFRTHHRERRC